MGKPDAQYFQISTAQAWIVVYVPLNGGSVIAYRDGRRIPFIDKVVYLFVALNLLPPGIVPEKDAVGRTWVVKVVTCQD